MTQLLKCMALAAMMLGLAAAPLRAAESGVMKVVDDAGLFSSEGIDKAKASFEGTTFKSPTHLLYVSVKSIPESKKSEFDAVKQDPQARSRFFSSWAREKAKSLDRKGDIVLLTFMDGKKYITVCISDEQSDVHRGFSDGKAREAQKIFDKGLKEVLDQKLTGADAKKEMDAALLATTKFVIDELKDTAAPETKTKVNRTANNGGEVRGGNGIMGFLCIGLAVMLGIWFVVALVRALTGGGGGGGYGGGGYGGGGGGGFFPSLLGGMFGAAAGMWLYDSFMGGHHGSQWGGSDMNAAESGNNYDNSDGNYDGGADGGGDAGGDWGGDTGGDMGGGGDWGGGGDMGGGGDFGGGGDW